MISCLSLLCCFSKPEEVFLLTIAHRSVGVIMQHLHQAYPFALPPATINRLLTKADAGNPIDLPTNRTIFLDYPISTGSHDRLVLCDDVFKYCYVNLMRILARAMIILKVAMVAGGRQEGGKSGVS